jgi:hypothetical protein
MDPREQQAQQQMLLRERERERDVVRDVRERDISMRDVRERERERDVMMREREMERLSDPRDAKRAKKREGELLFLSCPPISFLAACETC